MFFFTARRFVRYRITESTVSENRGHGISFKSTETKNNVFQIERSKITKNGLRATAGKTSLEGIHLNATNQVFTITNSYIAENENGGIYAELQKQDIPIALSRTNHILGNTIEHNRGKALFLQGKTGQPSDVKLTNNYVSFNLGKNLQQKRPHKAFVSCPIFSSYFKQISSITTVVNISWNLMVVNQALGLSITPCLETADWETAME